MSHYFSPKRCGMTCAVALVLLIAVALVQRRAVRILYHRGAMAWEWNAALKEMRQHAAAAMPGPMPPPSSLLLSLKHREALLGLGYLISNRFVISPISVDSRRYQEFQTVLSSNSAGLPVIMEHRNPPDAPKKVVAVTVFAPEYAMGQWREVLRRFEAIP